jgi:hypothetical protein
MSTNKFFVDPGGHTTEALALVSAIDPKKYHHRQYIVSEGDHLSAQKAKALESSIAEVGSTADFMVECLSCYSLTHSEIAGVLWYSVL